MHPHPDRAAANLALRSTAALPPPWQEPGPGSADARMPLKLLAARLRRALAERGTDAARARLAGLEGPDLWAGTVQDGTARGFAVALEEAVSLCTAEPDAPAPVEDPLMKVFEGKELRRKRECVVEAGGTRLRFSRKAGVHLVARKQGVNEERCMVFEDRTDTGDLDGFTAREGERPRLFSPAFLKPVLLEQGRLRDRLVLAGRLGRRPNGYPCRLVFEGRKDESALRVTIAVDNRHDDHRLRVRFLGIRPDQIAAAGTPGWEEVCCGHRHFTAATLVRACGRLRVGDELVAVPDAQCRGWIVHELRLIEG